jgi:hypothetical protein
VSSEQITDYTLTYRTNSDSPNNNTAIQVGVSITYTDEDGVLNDRDLDSDNDGCFDAVEGGDNFSYASSASITNVATDTGLTSVGNIATLYDGIFEQFDFYWSPEVQAYDSSKEVILDITLSQRP